MFKLGLLLCFSSVLAKLDKPTYHYILHEQFNRVDDPIFPVRRGLGESAWVLNLDEDVEGLKLRAVAGDEVKEVFGSRRRSRPSPRQGRRVKKDDPNKEVSSSETEQSDDDKAMISEIMRLINKFALTSLAEPDSYLSHDTDEVYPYLKLYFQDQRTSLLLRAEGRQWHYIIGPAIFPDWFYEDHHTVERDSRGIFVNVPTNVKKEFYSALHRMLTMFLRFNL